MCPKISPARKVALTSLLKSGKTGQFATVLVYEIADNKPLDKQDRAFAVKLVKGVKTYAPALEFAIHSVCDSKTRINRNVMDALMISAYEICYLKKEKHACVDQGVELVKLVSKNATGLANFILRRLDANSLPDKVSLKFGFKDELADFLIEQLDEKEALSFMKKSCLEPKINWETNFLKKVTNGARPRFALSSSPSPEVIFSASAEGEIIIADASAVLIAKSFAHDICENFDCPKVLEVGAGRGTKTALIQSFLAKENVDVERYDVLDSSKKRLLELKKRLEIDNLKIDEIYCADATKLTSTNFKSGTDLQTYDAIFIDSPCSGLGTLKRHPEIKSRFLKNEVENFAELGLNILKNVSKRARSGAIIYYSTCTISHEENLAVIDKFLDEAHQKDFALVKVVRKPCLTETEDAHFCACLKRF